MGRLVILGLLAWPLMAAGDETSIRDTFAGPWIEAIQSRDPEKVARFLHPAVLACRNPRTKEYFDFFLYNMSRYQAKTGYRVTISPLPTGAPAYLPEDGFQYPVKVTYQIQVDFGTTMRIGYLAQSNGTWYEVLPCPNEKGIQFAHQMVELNSEMAPR